jgi:hypothetical protein
MLFVVQRVASLGRRRDGLNIGWWDGGSFVSCAGLHIEVSGYDNFASLLTRSLDGHRISTGGAGT